MSNPELINIYSNAQQGGELPYFVGKQYGSGWLRTLARLAFPILAKFGKAAVSAAKDVVFKSKDILPSIKKHGMAAISSVIPGLFKKAEKRKAPPPPAKKTINKRRKMGNTIFK